MKEWSVESYLGLSAYTFLQSMASYHALELVRQLGNFWPSITTALMFLPSNSNWSIIFIFLVVLCLSMVSQKWKSDFHTSCTCIALLQDFMPLGWNHYGGYILFYFLFFIFILGQDTVLFYLNFMRRGKRPATAANGSSNVASKKGRWAGGLQTQLVNRALEGLSHGWEKSEMD